MEEPAAPSATATPAEAAISKGIVGGAGPVKGMRMRLEDANENGRWLTCKGITSLRDALGVKLGCLHPGPSFLSHRPSVLRIIGGLKRGEESRE